MKHTVSISIADRSGNKTEILKSRRIHIPQRLLRLLFGEFCEVFVMTPGQTVSSVEIHELRRGGEGHDE